MSTEIIKGPEEASRSLSLGELCRMDDGKLVDGLLRGEARYQLALLARYQDRLAQYLLRFGTLDSGDAEDIAVDVLNRLIMEPAIIDLSKGRGAVRGLVFKMAENRAIDLDRKRLSALAGRKLSSLDVRISASENVEGPEEPVDRRPWQGGSGPRYEFPSDVIEEIQKLVNELELTDDQWEHLRLRVVDKLQPKEIAALLEIKPNNERVRWHRLEKKIERRAQEYPRLLAFREEVGAVDLEA